jgi:hypothetical protein
MQNYLAGEIEIAINEVLIPASLLGDAKTTFKGGERDVDTLAGTFTQPSGMLDKPMLEFTLLLPSMDYLKVLFPDKYNAPTGRGANQGNIIVNTATCLTMANTPVNIHYTCDGNNDKNDVYIYNGTVQLDLSMTFNAKDVLNVPVTVYMFPDDNGNIIRNGAGDLSHNSYFDADTMQTVVS